MGFFSLKRLQGLRRNILLDEAALFDAMRALLVGALAASAVPAARSDDGGASLAQVGCDEAVAPGAIVDGVAALRSTARAAHFLRDGAPVACGGAYAPGETLAAALSGAGGAFVLEARGGGAFTDDEPAALCADDAAWAKNGAPAKDCAWVASLPDARCAVVGADGSLAADACLAACGGCVDDDDTWWSPNATCGASRAFAQNATFVAPINGSNISLTALWVQETVDVSGLSYSYSYVGYALEGALASDACVLVPGAPFPTPAPSLSAAPTTPPTHRYKPSAAPTAECHDVRDWYKKGAPSKDCDWVGGWGARCESVGEDGSLAVHACAASCGCSEAPTLAPTFSAAPSYVPTSFPPSYAPTFCNNSALWAKSGNPSKDCDWVAKSPAGRCEALGYDGADAAEKVEAYAACRFSCGCSAPPSGAPTSTFAPSVSPSTAPPSVPPTAAPSGAPTTARPTECPSYAPTSAPTYPPSATPTATPLPSAIPTYAPSPAPSVTFLPTYAPSLPPSIAPTKPPTPMPSPAPSPMPSPLPSLLPTLPQPPTAANEGADAPDHGGTANQGGADEWYDGADRHASHDICDDVCGGLSCANHAPETCAAALDLGCDCGGCRCVVTNATAADDAPTPPRRWDDDDVFLDDLALDDAWGVVDNKPRAEVLKQAAFARDPDCIDNNFKEDAHAECLEFSSDASCCGHFATEGACLRR